jgi:phytol kinase
VNEIKRKLFHLFCLIYMGVYAVLPRPLCLEVMGGLGLLIALLEWARLHSPSFNLWAWKRVEDIARVWERNSISGLFWTWLGSFLTMLIFKQREIVMAALGFMIFGDFAAALVGKFWGRHRWPGDTKKTIEGTTAFALAATCAGWWFLPPHVVILSAIAAAALESIRLPVDDNLWIPLVSGVCLTLARLI